MNKTNKINKGETMMMTDNKWIQTCSGKKFYPLHPDIENIDIKDIAWSLSNICRFNGHTSRFYSVAEHSVYASQYVPRKYALEGLMHDAAEAIIGDIATPIKKVFPMIRKVEHDIMKCIAKKYQLEYPFPASIKKVDLQLLATEAEQLMSPQIEPWPQLTESSLNFNIKCVKPVCAFNIFLKRYEQLKRR